MYEDTVSCMLISRGKRITDHENKFCFKNINSDI